MPEKKERRFLPIQEMRTSEEDGKMIIEGYPIVYEKKAYLWGWIEIVHRGAATEALKKSDEIVLWDHESGKPMARRKNGTLEVTEDSKGVHIRADVSKTVWGRDGYEAIKNGVVDKMSFAFTTKDQKWTTETKDGECMDLREIFSFDELYDYSPVSYPAYDDTELQARSKEIAFRNKPEPETSGESTPTGGEEKQAPLDLLLRKQELLEKEITV